MRSSSTVTASRCASKTAGSCCGAEKGLDWTEKFPATANAAKPFPDWIVDGEIVALDHNGAPDFVALQTALSEGNTDGLVFFAFDLLFIGREDLRELARFSHTIFSTKRGFAKRFVDVFRTSFRVAPRDARLVESSPVLRAQRRKRAPVGLRMVPRGDAMRRRVSGGRSASVCRGRKARGGQSPDGRYRTG
jgi:hypothetical protein